MFYRTLNLVVNQNLDNYQKQKIIGSSENNITNNKSNSSRVAMTSYSQHLMETAPDSSTAG